MASGLPFTPDQFFGVFAEYNWVFGLVAAGWWLGSVGLFVAVWRDPIRFSRVFALFLGVLWAWNAIVYHAWLFTRINPAAWLFAALFAIEAVLLIRAARGPVEYFSVGGPMRVAGISLVLYALAYPFLNLAFGHTYPSTPTFGVPCPTVILTAGALLAADRLPVSLTIIPVLWAFAGGSASVLLGVQTDYMLPIAGVLLIFASIAQRHRLPAVMRP